MSFSYENPLKKRFGSEFFRGIIETPGIYFMLDQQGSILYIGKAKNLRNRITSYSQIKPGQSAEHTLEMIEGVFSIHWQECASENEALVRENELLHAIRPPYNIAQTEPENYLFIGVKEGRKRGNSYLHTDLIKLDFQLSSHDWIQADGYQLYGCFKHRRKTKMGYSALLRLIHAATFEGKRFHCPARMARVSPPWVCSVDFPGAWRTSLEKFFKGQSNEILHLLLDRLLENEYIPGFIHASIQDDIEIVKQFFELGPKGTYQLKKKNKITTDFISQAQMDQLIASDLKILKMGRIA